MIALVAIAVSAVGWLSYRSLEQVLLSRVLDRIETHSGLVADNLESYVQGARGDIAAFRDSPTIDELIRAAPATGNEPGDGLSKALLARLAGRLVAELRAKPAYVQFRIIGVNDGGRELVRADRSGPNDAIQVVSGSDLRRKGDKDYFKETARLHPGGIYVSPIDLNEENGVIETPRVPTLRISTPLSASDGRLLGIIVINIDMRPAFDRLRLSAYDGRRIYVVNESGDYLVHPDPAREFGTQLGAPTRWQDDFPDLPISQQPDDSVAEIALDEAGQRGGATLAPALLAGDEWVGVIETVPNAVIMAPAEAIQKS
jgi:hypothetical protein